MRFIRTRTISLVEIPDSDVHSLPKGYAILSHRWLNDEIQLDQLRSGVHLDDGPGTAKLKNACELAHRLEFELLWMDTCCIDKNSSTELSETINSMYRWYSDAAVCLVYLPDISDVQDIESSVWFSRGWTLQELIAPKQVWFYNMQWQHLGSKHDLASSLSAITRVPERVLTGIAKPQTYSVAQRMSWAATRTTERIEDMAYSLLGLFNINMAMIYGEREQAFIRLQEEIIKKSADQSIFAWHLSTEQKSSGLIAPSVKAFQNCNDIFATSISRSFSISNTGLSIRLLTKPYSLEIFVVALEVARDDEHKIGIFLSHLPENGQYSRVHASPGLEQLLVHPDSTWKYRDILVQQNNSETPITLYQGIWLRQIEHPYQADYEPRLLSRGLETRSDRIGLPTGMVGTVGLVWMSPRTANDKLRETGPQNARCIKLGFNTEFEPVCLVSWSELRASQFAQTPYESFEQALSKPAGSLERYHSPIFNDAWVALPDSRPTDYYEWPHLCCIHKGDRRDGFEWLLPSLNLKIVMKRYPDHGTLIEHSTAISRPQEVWTADILTMIEAPGWLPHGKESGLCGGCC